MDIKKVPVSKVQLWDKNPRNIKTGDFERLKKQILELGVYKPLIAVAENGGYTILGGNMRLRALQEMGVKEVDISIVEAETEAKKIKFALSDNDRAGEYDEQQLAELVYPYIEDIDLSEYKVDLGEAVDLQSVIEDYGPDLDEGEDEVPEVDDTPAITKRGDLFTLGRHRLLCGDATSAEDVARLMGREKADMVFTDPPYNVASENKIYAADVSKSMANLKSAEWDKNFDIQPALDSLLDILAESVSVYICTSHHLAPIIWKWMATWATHHSWCVWHKTNPMPSLSKRHWTWDGELIPYATRGGHIFNFPKSGHAPSVWDIAKRRESSHPTEKPSAVPGMAIKHSSDPSGRIADPFLGSGTTLIACEKLNRICYGMEIEPKYCDVIITRYCNYTETSEDDIRATVKHG